MLIAALSRRPWGWAFLLLASLFFSTEAFAEDTTLRVQLVWGTNDPKPESDKHLKEVDAKLADELRSLLKWMNYFQVEEKVIALPKKGDQKLKLSPKCEVVLRFKDENTVEIQLIGEGQLYGKPQQKQLQELKGGHRWTIGGKDTQKWGDAWFVVVSVPPAKK
jgi:hypothetical protein